MQTNEGTTIHVFNNDDDGQQYKYSTGRSKINRNVLRKANKEQRLYKKKNEWIKHVEISKAYDYFYGCGLVCSILTRDE